MDFRYRNIILVGLLVVLTYGVYARIISHDFITYDDPYYITNNSMIQKGATPESFRWALHTYRAGFWIPLTWASFIIDHELFGLFAGGYLYVNLFWHMANTLLVFFLLRLMTGAVWRSFLVALLFGIHPIHVESVAWAVERKDVLSTFFFLIAVGAYFFYRQKSKPWLYGLLVVSFVLSLMAKPMYVTLPVALLLLDYWPLNRFLKGSPKRWQTKARPAKPGNSLFSADTVYCPLLEKIPLLLISAFFSVFNLLIAARTNILQSVQNLSPADRLANAVVCCLKYLQKIFWPEKLGVLYPHPGHDLAWPEITLAAVVLTVITVGVLLAGRKHRYLPMGWFWFLIVLSPVSGLLQNGHQAMADRFVYMPLLGLLVIVVWGGHDLVARLKLSRTFVLIFTAIIVAALLVRTFYQVNYWRDSLPLYKRTLAVTENNYLMHDYAGIELVQQGKIDLAFPYFKKAIAINPDYPDAYFSAGTYLMFHGRLDKAEKYLRRSIELGLRGENRERAEKNLDRARRARQDPAELIWLYEKTLLLKPEDQTIRRSLDKLKKR